MVAHYAGSDPHAKAILLLAHLDVVEAKREDWTRDPFKLIEENGNFYARGASDDKAQAAMWVDTLIRLREESIRPKRTVKIALTCGEEGGPFNGAQWLAQNKRELIDAAFALNEGGGGELDEKGRRLSMNIAAGEKTYQDYSLEVTNIGGHSSVPRTDNAIYHLANALIKIENYPFPVQISDGSRGYFEGMAKIQAAKGQAKIAQAMETFAKNPKDQQAAQTIASGDPAWAARLYTTCVATMLNAGHAPNALPQRAHANINCRIFPGVEVEAVRQKLVEVIGNPKVKVELVGPPSQSSSPPPLTPNILDPVKKLTEEFWPGVPVLPSLMTGATDAIYIGAAGIPTYGIEGIFTAPDIGNIHGLNEYVGVNSLLEGREFLYRLVKIYANQP